MLSNDYIKVMKARTTIGGKVRFVVSNNEEKDDLVNSMRRLFEHNWPIYAKLIIIDPNAKVM